MHTATVLNENFIIKEVDTKHVFQIGLAYDDGTPDLTGATATLYIANDNGLLVEKALTISDGNLVSFSFDDGDIAQAGTYDVEVVVIYADGKRETFPDTSYLKLKVLQNLQNRGN